MNKIINFLVKFFILGLATISCSTDEIFPEISPAISYTIPNEYQGGWKVKYRYKLNGILSKVTSDMAKIYYSHSIEWL